MPFPSHALVSYFCFFVFCCCGVLQLVSELATQSAAEEKLLSQQKEAAARFGFFQRTRNALSDLCGMLREKV